MGQRFFLLTYSRSRKKGLATILVVLCGIMSVYIGFGVAIQSQSALGLRSLLVSVCHGGTAPTNSTFAVQEEEEYQSLNGHVKESVSIYREWKSDKKYKSTLLGPDMLLNVSSEVELRRGFDYDEVDKAILNMTAMGKFVLHQTWKTRCVLENKVEHMKSWLKVEKKKLRVVYWTDRAMDMWVEQHFRGTRVQKVWDMYGEAYYGSIKRSDFFRALVIWFYGSVYADLDISLHASLRPVLKQGLTLLVYEPNKSMKIGEKYNEKEESTRLMILSGLTVSGSQYSPFLGYYVNWIVEKHLSGLSGPDEFVVDATGPVAEAQSLVHYIERISHHDYLLRVISYEEFHAYYGTHHTESTWALENKEKVNKMGCNDIATVYGNDTVLLPYEE